MSVDHAAERSLYLQDWGVAIRHLAVQQNYDPLTQSVVEAITETALLAIAGPLDAGIASGTAGQHRREQRVFLVDVTQWPEITAGQVRRVQFSGEVYDVVETQQSEIAGLLAVTGVKLM